MFARSDKTHSGSFFSNLLDRAGRAVARWDEINSLTSQELEGIARDLRISTPDLLSLAQASPGSADQLDRRLGQSGLSKDVLAARHGDVVRDLERVCGLCGAKERCAADLDSSDHVEQQPEYCPNELTLEALARESAQHDRLMFLAVHQRAVNLDQPVCAPSVVPSDN
jgi:uncharacterized protein DUF6455